MKVAIVVNTFPPRLGGLEQHLKNLAHELIAQGHEITVFTVADSPGVVLEPDGLKVVTFRGHFSIQDVIRFPELGTKRRIISELRSGRFDAISTHTRFFPMSYLGTRAAIAVNLPVVHTEHGSGFVANSSWLIRAGSIFVDLTIGRYVLRHATRVLGVSEHCSSFVKKISGVNARTFYNAIPSPDFASITCDSRPSHFVFVGRMVEGKGWDTVLRALGTLRDRGFDFDAEMLGGGKDLEKARSLAAELHISDRVEVPGPVSPEEVLSSLAGATLVNATTLSEGFQTTLLETLAVGGRVITFDVPGAKVLSSEGMPVLITPSKTLDSLVSTIENYLHHPLEPARKERLTKWFWPERAREYSQILREAQETFTNQHRDYPPET